MLIIHKQLTHLHRALRTNKHIQKMHFCSGQLTGPSLRNQNVVGTPEFFTQEAPYKNTTFYSVNLTEEEHRFLLTSIDYQW